MNWIRRGVPVPIGPVFTVEMIEPKTPGLAEESESGAPYWASLTDGTELAEAGRNHNRIAQRVASPGTESVSNAGVLALATHAAFVVPE